ncbi:hypothetical protein MN116_000576, partial [Schistosoma mekongi]
AFDKIAPLRQAKPRIPKDLFIPTQIRRRLRKHASQFHRSRDFSSLVTIKEIYVVTVGIRMEKAIVEEKQAIINKSPSVLLKIFRNKNKGSKTKGNLFISENRIYDNPKLIAELFSEHFSTTLTSGNYEDDYESTATPSCELTNVVFTRQNIDKAINTLKYSNTEGPDGIPASILKRGDENLHLLLLKLFTISLSTACYPTIWKTTYIIPKLKSGPVANVENYRPINLTSVISRVMEKVVKVEVSQYLQKHNLISTSQHGFLKTRSCDTCLLDYLNDITTQRDRGMVVSTVFLDFKKALDKVPHYKLLHKLKSFGIKDPLHSWLSSFITGRSQVVKYNDHLSSPKLITSGVVQGSVLGPLLFLMYINDICEVIHFGRPYLYADDLKIVYSFKPSASNEGTSDIQKDLDNLSIWSQKWQLPFNHSKCGIMQFGKYDVQQKLYLNECKIQTLSSVCDLGICYSKSLKFTEHVSSIISKSRRRIGFILRNFYTMEAKLAIYRMCVRPTLEYCSLVFSNMNYTDTIRIENLQRTFTRRLLEYNCNKTYVQRCKSLSLEPLWRRRLKTNLIYFHKIIHGLSFSTFYPSWKTALKYNLRNLVRTLYTEKCKHKSRNNFFITLHSLLWNRLPLSIRSCDNLPKFKRMISLFFNTKGTQQPFPELSRNPDMISHGPPHI